MKFLINARPSRGGGCPHSRLTLFREHLISPQQRRCNQGAFAPARGWSTGRSDQLMPCLGVYSIRVARITDGRSLVTPALYIR